MLRRSLISLLLDNPTSLTALARLAKQTPPETEEELDHLFKNLEPMGYKASVTPAQCQKCGFTFGPDKLSKSSKCPKCRSTKVTEPLLSISEQPPKT